MALTVAAPRAAAIGELLLSAGEQVNIVTRLAPGLPDVIGDAGQFEQVLLNLALNARDAMPGGGTLLLETGVTQVAEACASPLCGRSAELTRPKRHLYEVASGHWSR